MSRFPWDTVKGWSVTSRADGSLLIEPDYINPYKGPEEGGGPGLMTRMALADWCLNRLCKRRVRAAEPYVVPPGMCPAPIGGKLTARECIAAGQCGCDQKGTDAPR